MDASPDVAPQEPARQPDRHRQWAGPSMTPRDQLQRAAGAEVRSAEEIRRQLYLTLDDLHARVAELQSYVQTRFGSIADPFHIREKVEAHPAKACGVALVAGLVCGALRVHTVPRGALRRALRVSGGVVRGASSTFGSQVASSLVRQWFRS